MKPYVGTKLINARPMTRQAYNDFRGWTLPADENGDDPGFLVEYVDGGKANTPQYAGYVSWSPADVFERAYRPVVGMAFGDALAAIKAGQRVARAGWNGAGQFVSMSGPLGGSLVEADKFWSPHNAEFARQNGGHLCVLPSLSLKNAQNAIIMGWVPSTGDLFAEDWQIV